jgi:hypothetical protein
MSADALADPAADPRGRRLPFAERDTSVAEPDCGVAFVTGEVGRRTEALEIAVARRELLHVEDEGPASDIFLEGARDELRPLELPSGVERGDADDPAERCERTHDLPHDRLTVVAGRLQRGSAAEQCSPIAALADQAAAEAVAKAVMAAVGMAKRQDHPASIGGGSGHGD